MSERSELSASDKLRSTPLGDTGGRKANPWLVLLGTSLSMCLLAGACFCGGAWWLFRPVVREDPLRAEQLAPELLSISIPPNSWVAKGTIEWNLAFLFRIRGAYFQRKGGDGVLAIVEVQEGMTRSEDVQRHIRQTLLTDGVGDSPINVDPTQTRSVKVQLGDQEATFKFETASDPPRVFHLVEGVVQGHGGEILLTLRLPENEWNEPEVLRLLESIRGTAAQTRN